MTFDLKNILWVLVNFFMRFSGISFLVELIGYFRPEWLAKLNYVAQYLHQLRLQQRVASVGEYWALANAIFPLYECIQITLMVVALKGICVGIRLIKGFTPTLG